ncbi:MAG: SsrA-binding protein SmpB [Cryobacterium sp.]|nr:SsrA-binding protein SmpB [Oligoflexia bacterium]
MARPQGDEEQLIATNPNARSDYFITEVVEAGLVLTGTEIKSIRATSPNIRDAFVDIQGRLGKKLEAYLQNMHVGHYSHGNIWNHEEKRKRKLLLHRHQIERLYGALVRDGMSIIPLRMYFKKGKAKIEIGLGKGKRKSDKRDDVKKKSADREIEKAMKRGRK